MAEGATRDRSPLYRGTVEECTECHRAFSLGEEVCVARGGVYCTVDAQDEDFAHLYVFREYGKEDAKPSLWQRMQGWFVW